MSPDINILRPAFSILAVCGCWRLSVASATCKRIGYLLYTVFVLLLVYSFCISQLLNVILNVRTADELSDSLYMLIASILACCKVITLLLNRRNIRTFIEELEKEPCKPMDAHELDIRNNYDTSIGSITIYYTIMVEFTVLCMILSSLFTDFRGKRLTYAAWLPFDISETPHLYYLAYGHQAAALVATSLMNVACDVMFCGLYVHAQGQQEILKHRLQGIEGKASPDIGELVRFHDYLYGYTFTIQEKFKGMIGVQLLSSTLIVCFTLYELTNTPPMTSKYLQFVLYMVCMMTQIFIYCWYGNQLKLKSVELVDTISDMDWLSLDNSNMKCLIMIMMRAKKPIALTCAYVFTVDLTTFVNILKMSYSTYNFLHRTKEQ